LLECLKLCIAASLPVEAIILFEELRKHCLKRGALLLRSGTNQAGCLILWDRAFAGVIDIEQAGINPMLQQREMRCCLQIIANVARIVIHTYAPTQFPVEGGYPRLASGGNTRIGRRSPMRSAEGLHARSPSSDDITGMRICASEIRIFVRLMRMTKSITDQIISAGRF
jgi:hypothetical protein